MQVPVVEVTVAYYVQYPDGRRNSVTEADALQWGERWAAEYAAQLVTVVTQRSAPLLGAVEWQEAP